MSDIFQQLEIESIPGLADFLDAPVPVVEEPAPGLDSVPISQRVQGLLTTIFGAAWMSAHVASWTLPTGHEVHIGFGPPPEPGLSGLAMHMVGAREDGELALATPLPNGNDDPDMGIRQPEIGAEGQPWTARDEDACLSEILPALQEISVYIHQSDALTRQRRLHLCEQIDHAIAHLKINAEMWREDEEARQEGDAQ